MDLVFLVLAFGCFLLAALPMGNPYWNRLIAAGLCFWVATQFLTRLM